jgi:hypothetical protein
MVSQARKETGVKADGPALHMRQGGISRWYTTRVLHYASQKRRCQRARLLYRRKSNARRCLCGRSGSGSAILMADSHRLRAGCGSTQDRGHGTRTARFPQAHRAVLCFRATMPSVFLTCFSCVSHTYPWETHAMNRVSAFQIRR